MTSTLRLHVGYGRLDAVNRTPEVHVEKALHVLQVAVGDGREQPHTGVVDQDVNGAKLLHRLAHEGLDGQPVCDVRGYDKGCLCTPLEYPCTERASTRRTAEAHRERSMRPRALLLVAIPFAGRLAAQQPQPPTTAGNQDTSLAARLERAERVLQLLREQVGQQAHRVAPGWPRPRTAAPPRRASGGG